MKSAVFRLCFSHESDSNLNLQSSPNFSLKEMRMPKYLVEIILVVEAKNPQEARKVADYILNLPIPDSNIENAIETMRYEEVVQIENSRAEN